MKQNMVDMYPEYKDVFLEKLSQLDFMTNSAYVIFLDGKNATKHHDKDMLSENGFIYNLHKAACELINELKIECQICTIMDEVTFIFKNGKVLEQVLDEDNEDCILSLFTLKFFEIFSKYDHCLFKGCIYPVDIKNTERIIKFRQTVGFNTALMYFAKEYIPASERHNKTYDEIKEALRKHQLYDEFLHKTFLYKGFCSHLNKPKKLDVSMLDNTTDIIMKTDSFGFPI